MTSILDRPIPSYLNFNRGVAIMRRRYRGDDWEALCISSRSIFCITEFDCRNDAHAPESSIRGIKRPNFWGNLTSLSYDLILTDFSRVTTDSRIGQNTVFGGFSLDINPFGFPLAAVTQMDYVGLLLATSCPFYPPFSLPPSHSIPLPRHLLGVAVVVLVGC